MKTIQSELIWKIKKDSPRVLIVWALSQEINIIKEEIKKLDLINFKTSFLTVGIWNYNMILNLTRFLEKHNFDIVLNIGVCGHIFENENIEDFIQISRIYNISNKKELLIPRIIKFWKSESIACSEKIIYNDKKIYDEKYVDMESYGFEITCDSFSIPRVILKVPVDKIWKETKNFDFKKAENSLRKNINYKELFLKIEEYIENHFSIWKWKYKIHHDLLEKYNNVFNFTFSENEIFKRLYYRYLALVNKDFNLFFNKNKNLNKKEFLKNLDKHLEKYLIK